MNKAERLAASLQAAFTAVNMHYLTEAGMPEWKADLLVALKNHANREYDNGYDVVIECYSIGQVLDIVGSAYTLKTYIARMDEEVGARQEQIANCY